MSNVKENHLHDGEKMQIEDMQKCKYEYVMALKHTLNGKLFTKDFDNWTLSQQYDWVNKNLRKFYPNVPESLLHLIPAFFRQDECGRSQIDVPIWLDVEKYHKGQKFVHDYYTPIIMGTFLSVLHTYSFGDELKPLILGAKSHTPYLAFKRYHAIILRNMQIPLCAEYSSDYSINASQVNRSVKKKTNVVHKSNTSTYKEFNTEEFQQDFSLTTFRIILQFPFLSAQSRVESWYNGEPWVKETCAYKDMQFTRKIHQIVRTKASQLSEDTYDALCTFANPWCPDRELLLKDFTAACSLEKLEQLLFKLFTNSPYRPKPLNHADLVMLQYALMGMVVLHPHKYGAHDATEEELEGFCHMWRCYGYLLGIEDEYNLCRGSLKETRQLIQDLSEYWIIPYLKYATPEWEHITRCMVQSFNYFPMMYMPYRSALLLDMDILGVNMSYLYASLSYSEWIAYFAWKFVLRYVMKSSYIRVRFNKMINSNLKDMYNLNPEKDKEYYEKSIKQIKDFCITN
ncbi:uncharacterized protein LOC105184300 isoform X1 [Harpegnathos saltator]|uniref:uncharacterized protein LOC105184300 isoform X1 n=1 Tax=Harpegnathos saltator TaxID=610380 RepID=UPI000DBEDB4F|nr:uncharacterized protein LOC105184300 isoform X1 [Harpegnathos saltator]